MADDKFILMGLNDDKAGNIAEVLNSKTSKKILDYLAETKEASEKDMADGLNMPINTVEYNLKKLIKSGLVEKTKNFFWSVKGKKIPMYKLARKHIIISPNKSPSLSYLKNILPIILIAAILTVFLSLAYLFPDEQGINRNNLNKFKSDIELKNFLKDNSDSRSLFRGIDEMIDGRVAKVTGVSDMQPSSAVLESAESDDSAGGASEYSTTNIQVEGVDEADIVKNDGKYIYVVSTGKIVIVDAYPAKEMNILSEIKLSGVRDIYINGNKLIVFLNSYQGGFYEYEAKSLAPDERHMPVRFSNSVYIYDISDKENPKLENEIDMDGDYVNSRMIGDYVYVILTKYANLNNPEPPIYALDGAETKIAPEEIYYFNYHDNNYVFTSIMAINVRDGELNSEVYLISSSSNIYVSQNNIYLTYQKTMDYKYYVEEIAEKVYLPLLSEEHDVKIQGILDSNKQDYIKLNEMQKRVIDYSSSLRGSEKADFDRKLSEKLNDFEVEIQKQLEKTVIHKININKEDIEYKGAGEVPGYVLNQFSMDEYNGDFRIATTTGDFWKGTSANNLYILNSDLEMVGKTENLAEGEKIYSVRFMGNRAYMVTFKKVDPLFVIDVSNPEEPEVLGYLKITGYSDYLHPYDENHIIGIGKEAIATGEEDINARDLNFAWYQGIKISLFDVNDVKNPVEVDKIEIGDRGTESIALYEHKAFLFDKERNLLVIPISLSEIDEIKYAGYDELPATAYGERVWEGAYVLNIGLDGISVRGKITHNNKEDAKVDYGYKYFPYYNQIKRSLYMDDVLYTLSDYKIKANNIDTIDEISYIEWKGNKNDYPVLMDDVIMVR